MSDSEKEAPVFVIIEALVADLSKTSPTYLEENIDFPIEAILPALECVHGTVYRQMYGKPPHKLH